jgi:hypothetical protein
MNYQRNYLYFKNPRKYNFWWLLLFLLIAGGAIYASFSGMLTPTYLGYVLGGILLLLGISFGAFFPLRCRIKDSYIDKQVRDGVVMFEKLALDQLKITPLKSDVLQTVRLPNPLNTKISKSCRVRVMTKRNVLPTSD